AQSTVHPALRTVQRREVGARQAQRLIDSPGSAGPAGGSRNVRPKRDGRAPTTRASWESPSCTVGCAVVHSPLCTQGISTNRKASTVVGGGPDDAAALWGVQGARARSPLAPPP